MNEIQYRQIVENKKVVDPASMVARAIELPSQPRQWIDHTCQVCQKQQRFANHPGAMCWGCQERLTEAAVAKSKRFANCGVSARHRRFEKWEELKGVAAYSTVISRLQAFTDTCTAILALIGKRGTGKTQMASVAVLTTIAVGRSAKIITAVDLLADLKNRYSNPEEGGEREWLRYWEAFHLLVIDEIGELVGGDHSRSMLTTMIDRRYAAMKPTILIGNVTVKDFSVAVGSSVADRCNEGGGVIVCDSWTSFRK